MKHVELKQGRIAYRDEGQGRPVVFVHGVLVNGQLWRKMIPLLRDDFRVIVPDWPLGSHRDPLKESADRSPLGLARLIHDFLVALDLRDVILVGNDSGGALSQLVVTHHPERISQLVLTNCDAFENFPPPFFDYLKRVAKSPATMWLMAQSMRVPAARRLPIAFGWLTKRPIAPEIVAEWVRPVIESPAIRSDIRDILLGFNASYTEQAAEDLRNLEIPVLFTWARARFFPFEHAERLAARIPNARVVEIEDSGDFVSEDQPEALAAAIREFGDAGTAKRTGAVAG